MPVGLNCIRVDQQFSSERSNSVTVCQRLDFSVQLSRTDVLGQGEEPEGIGVCPQPGRSVHRREAPHPTGSHQKSLDQDSLLPRLFDLPPVLDEDGVSLFVPCHFGAERLGNEAQRDERSIF